MTGVLSTILVMAAGGIGATARFVVGVLARRLSQGPETARVVGVGLCGGFTTFSTASLEAVKLWAEEGVGRATAYTAVTLTGTVGAAWLGLAIAGGA